MGINSNVMQSSSNQLLSIVRGSRKANAILAQTSTAKRRLGVSTLAQSLEDSFDRILEANTLDLEISRDMAISEPVAEWLKLTPERLEIAVSILKQLAQSADPTRRMINTSYQLEPSQTYSQLIPLGTIALIYEAFPELAAIAAGMCLKTGNSLISRGCSAGSNSNQVIAEIIQKALADTKLPLDAVVNILPDSEISVQELVSQDRYLDLVIPYGRPSLVQQITENASATVLRTTIGNCYLYWSVSGNIELVRHAIIDSHQGVPDAVNAIEKVLVNQNLKPAVLRSLLGTLQEQGFNLRGDDTLQEKFPEYLQLIQPEEWRRPYFSKTVSFRLIENLPKAVTWINRNSSGHADCIVTESYQEVRSFVRQVDSALVYINTSPKFSRNPEGGEGVFLGMSNQKGYRQGLISVETFTTTKQVVQG